MVTLNGNSEDILAYVRNSGLSEEKYLALVPEMKLYQELFKLKYKEDETNPAFLTKRLGLSSEIELAKRAAVLDAWLASVMGGSVRPDWISYVCPECLNVAVIDDAERGDRVCMSCAVVVDASYDDGVSFDDSLDRDVTFQPSSSLSFTGLGGTLKGTDFHKLLADNRVIFSEFQKTNPNEARDLMLLGDLKAAKNGVDYCLSKDYVYHRPHATVLNFFHQLDKPLRKSRLAMIVDSYTNDNKGVLIAAYRLSEKYGIESQTFKNTLGTNVLQARKLLKEFGNSRPRITPLVETVFYLTLLDFKKVPEIRRIKPSLKNIDLNIANLIYDYRNFKLDHKKPNFNPANLNVYEKRCLK